MAMCKVLHARRTNRMTDYTMERNIPKKVREEQELGVMVHKAMNGSRQVAEKVKKANRALPQISRTISNEETESHRPIYKATVRHHIEYCTQAWGTYLKKDINALEKVQHRATKICSKQRMKNYDTTHCSNCAATCRVQLLWR